MRQPFLIASTLGLAAVLMASQALAWGGAGHRMIGMLALQALPPEIPDFLREPGTAAEVGELARELDRSKGAGKVHDFDRDSAHFLDLELDGSVLGGPRLAALPPTRADYESALRAVGADSWKAGYLPYSIIDRWQQLAKDFAYWRADVAGARFTASPERRAWLDEDRRRREGLILRTLGDLAHFVGDGSQPLHVSSHYNGWGDGPNPKSYTSAKIHGPFEGDLVKAYVSSDAVRDAMRPYRACNCPIEARVAGYLAETGSFVEPLYALEKAGGLTPGDVRGPTFATGRLGVGASELRDLVIEAWKASATQQVGWKPISVADVEAGKIDPFDALYGVD